MIRWQRMNKKLTLSVMALLVQMSVTTVAAADAVSLKERIEQPNSRSTAAVSVTDGMSVIPVDLDRAARDSDPSLPQPPVKLTADSLSVRASDHRVQGRGNVDVYQGVDELHTGYVEGNSQSQQYHAPGEVLYISGGQVVNGKDMVYDGAKKSASMATVNGYVQGGDVPLYIRGTSAQLDNGVVYIRRGLITTPHAVAETPDYYLTGDDIRIYPGDRFTSENTKLWFKHVCILTYGHYEGNLTPEGNKRSWLFSLLPQPTYNSDDGLGLRGATIFPLNQNGGLSLDVAYQLHFSGGFKPQVLLHQRTHYGDFTFGYSKEESTDNTDHIWAVRWPELRYYLPRLYFGGSGIYLDGSAAWGRWSEDGRRTGLHKGYRGEISHAPIAIWNGADVRFFAGYRRDLYDAYTAERSDSYWGTVLHQRLTDRLWTTLWYRKHNISGYTPYRFDTIDKPRQKGISLGYVLTPRDTFIFSLGKDLDNGDISERNYTWVRDLHSFVATVTYKQIEKQWDVAVIAKDFDL